MEYVRERKYSVYIDTSKKTINESFQTLQELIDFCSAESLSEYSQEHPA